MSGPVMLLLHLSICTSVHLSLHEIHTGVFTESGELLAIAVS